MLGLTEDKAFMNGSTKYYGNSPNKCKAAVALDKITLDIRQFYFSAPLPPGGRGVGVRILFFC